MSLNWAELSGSHVSRRTWLKFAGGAALAFGAAACGSPPGSSQGASGQGTSAATRGGTLTAAWNISGFTSLDPQLMVGADQMSAMVNVLEGLVRLGPALDVQPALATSWTVSSDGLTYTFHLRDGVKWHNGDDFTAQDMVFTYKRGIQASLGSPSLGQLGPVSGVEVPNDRTVVFHLSKPYAPFLASACTGMPGRILSPVNQRALAKMGAKQYGLTPVGTGPFKITAHNVGSSLTLSRFDDYWDKRYPLLDEIKINIIPEVATVQSALQSGDAQFAEVVAPESVAALKAAGVTVSATTGPNWWGLWMNYKSAAAPFLADKRVRLAFAKAIDRSRLVSTALFGQGTPGYGPIGPAMGYFYDSGYPAVQAYDLSAAKKLMSDADATGVKVEYMTNAGFQRTDEIIADMLTQIGVNVSTDIVETTVYSQRGYSSGDYQILHSGAADKPDSDFLMYDWFHSKGSYNTAGYSSANVDALFEQERAAVAASDQRKFLWQIQDDLINDAASAFTYHNNDLMGVGQKVHGFAPVCGLCDFRATYLSA
jgi:peptide/nickel transport system substrate-binding protein